MRKRRKILELEKQNQNLREQLRALSRLEDETPKGCKRGGWCSSCVHGNSAYTSGGKTYVCKLGACQHYTPREAPTHD